MDTTLQMPQNVTLPSHFWRRFAAYTVDIIIFQAAILIAVYYFSTISPLDFLLNGRTSMQCSEAVPDQLAQRIDAEWPLRTTETRTSEICEVSRIGSGKQRYLEIDVAIEPWDYVTPAQVLTIPVDADNNPVTKTIPGYTSLMSSIANTALIALAFACFSAKGRRTFGKAVFFLRVRSVDGKDPNFGTAFKREILKFSPNLLLSLVVFTISLFPVYPTEDFDALLGMFRNGYTPEDNGTAISYFIWTIAVMAWWGWPFIVWKGQTFYDRICACKVVSA
ncbi:RDD family protein [Rhizobium sp. LARHSG275]|uniref:RDD family protein n=1 Tax=Rhizobium TaxID=379 RepID=UPI001389C0BC|nr:RDD family protein [Rhizobium laguerreae]NDK51005.1 RDD family protein [Rhizobium laguerreae]